MRVLYITHYSVMEPLGQSQILPYLKGLAERGHSIEIISFEKQPLLGIHDRVRAQEQTLRDHNIHWSPRAYRRGESINNLTLDIARTWVEIGRRHRSERYDLIHARSHVPGLMSWLPSKIHRIPVLFDFRGFVAEEYVDAGLWREGGIKFRMGKLLERMMCAHCRAMVVLTHPMKEFVRDTFGISPHKIFVIPCCVDTNRFKPSCGPSDHSPNRPLKVVYSGSTDGRYDLAAMLRFFALLLEKRHGSRFTILSTGSLDKVRAAIARSGLPSEAVTALTLGHDQVPSVLAEQDIGLFFLRGRLTLMAASPTKIGEYLACGLTVVAEQGIGGLNDILLEHHVGRLVDSSEPSSWNDAADEIIEICERSGRRQASALAAAKCYSLRDGVNTYSTAYEYATWANK